MSTLQFYLPFHQKTFIIFEYELQLIIITDTDHQKTVDPEEHQNYQIKEYFF